MRDGEIYARGAADDKGQVFLHFKAVEAHLKEHGRLRGKETVEAPCRVEWYHYDTAHPGGDMANILVRNLDDEVLQQLKSAANAHGRSLQAEIHAVLHAASRRRLAETRRLSKRWLERLEGAPHTDSAALIRADRETR